MRAIISAASALILTACNGDTAANEAVAANASEEVEMIPANDVTAIDAVTNDAAEMAQDVAITANLADNQGAEDGDKPAARPSDRPQRRPAARPEPRPAETDADDSEAPDANAQ